MVNRTFEEVNAMLPLMNMREGGYSTYEFVCDFYNLEDLRRYFENENRKYESDKDEEFDEEQTVKNLRYMFKRIKLINPKQWRILKITFKELNS